MYEILIGLNFESFGLIVRKKVMIGYPIRTNPRFSYTSRIRNVNLVNTRGRVRSYTSQCSDELKRVRRVGKRV